MHSRIELRHTSTEIKFFSFGFDRKYFLWKEIKQLKWGTTRKSFRSVYTTFPFPPQRVLYPPILKRTICFYKMFREININKWLLNLTRIFLFHYVCIYARYVDSGMGDRISVYLSDVCMYTWKSIQPGYLPSWTAQQDAKLKHVKNRKILLKRIMHYKFVYTTKCVQCWVCFTVMDKF